MLLLEAVAIAAVKLLEDSCRWPYDEAAAISLVDVESLVNVFCRINLGFSISTSSTAAPKIAATS